VADAERVVGAFVTHRKARRPVDLADPADFAPPAGEDFMWIALVADIPDQAVFRGVEYIMQRDRQLDGAESGGEMPARAGDALEQIIPQLIREPGQLAFGELTKMRRGIDSLEQWVGAHVHGVSST